MFDYNLDYIKNENGRNEIRKFIKDYRRKEPLKVLTVENGVILPQREADYKTHPNAHMGLGGVVDQFGDFVKLSGIKAVHSEDMVFGGKYDYPELVEEQDEEVLYMGVFRPHWGHFLLEYCTRLWYSLQCGNKYKIAYCGYNCKQNEGIQGPYKEFLELLGIDQEQLIDIRKPTKYKKIIIPEQSFLRNQYYTDEYRNIIDFAYENIDKKNLIPYDNVYFSRVQFIEKKAPNRECGEREIQETFEANGYKILAPEAMPVREQMFYVRNCKKFAVIAGSASANSVFAANGAERIYIRKSFITVPDMFQIDQMTNSKNVTFIDCYYKPYKAFPINLGGARTS